jgi:hypothetical protein
MQDKIVSRCAERHLTANMTLKATKRKRVATSNTMTKMKKTTMKMESEPGTLLHPRTSRALLLHAYANSSNYTARS